MSSKLTKNDAEKIAELLQVAMKDLGSYYRIVLENPENKHRLALELHPEVSMGEESGTLISVYTTNAHLQLQCCTGYVLSESLGEVTFYADSGDKISGLIIDRTACCSVYSNVDRSILSGDFSALVPEVMMSSVALSLTEQELK